MSMEKKKTLVVAEKYPAACDIAKVLKCTEKKDGYIQGGDYIITWADGHLIGYQYPEEYNPDYKKWKMEDLPLKFDPEQNLKVLEGKEKQFEVVKRLIQGPETDLVINAGDAGREGYLLQYWIYKMAENKKPVKVLWASSLTEKAIAEAFANLHDDSEFDGVLEEALARAEMDYILGMNYSRLLTLKCSSDGVTLPYGRCMTTLLNLIVEREKAINYFQPVKTYTIETTYKDGFKGTIIDPEEKALEFATRVEAEKVLEELTCEGTVCSIKEKEIKEKAPFLYSLPVLQGVIGKKYKYAPEKTLKIAQTLYEKYKIISYPRTDAQVLSSDLQNTIEHNLECCRFGKFKAALERCEKYTAIDSVYFDDSKITDHHALIPVENDNMQRIYEKLTQEERNVFDEIVYSFLGLFCKERITGSITAVIMVEGYLFRSTESIEKQAGFKLLRKIDTENEEINAFFQDVKDGKQVEIVDIQVKEKVSGPPSRYTYGTITELMMKYHIGTPATMAATIEKLQDKNTPFLTVKNGKYYSTSLGKMYISVIPEELKMPEITEQMEWDLSQIRMGKKSREEFIQEIMDELNKNIQRTDFQKKSFKKGLGVKAVSRGNYKRKMRHWE